MLQREVFAVFVFPAGNFIDYCAIESNFKIPSVGILMVSLFLYLSETFFTKAFFILASLLLYYFLTSSGDDDKLIVARFPKLLSSLLFLFNSTYFLLLLLVLIDLNFYTIALLIFLTVL